MAAGVRKVVICSQHGGFSLSMAGEVAFLARKGKTPHFYTNPRVDGQISFDDYVRVRPEDTERHFVTYTLLEDLGDSPTREAVNGSRAWFSARDIQRDDPDLVAVVEELGKAADGSHATLTVVEIPDDVAWTIEEYDGLEWVAEEHRTWS